ncbi:NAD(P)-dependent oxidoreductase [Mariprofundus sp. KV]|uniref:NAD(P)-dependent oxidoreductase n=1 Tax=Mariprofundus sp. KV TaxID=2608715 RepID=UPI0015A0D3FA|nr:NAD(P)-dependent oxidoreductase [Mariprofundus sp. KV]NWF37347.1 NAD(P)-dependent oxidoreductase [Mariprofundus sp. KV]
MQQRIGFIGLGIMGQAMAANILKAGYGLTVYNRSSHKAEALAAAGATLAHSPKELTERCEIIILMLTGPEAVDAILQGENGVLASECSGKTVINMSTVPPAYSRQLNQQLESYGITAIDAPVSGSKIPAEQGTLVILAGGDEAAIKQLEPLLLSMGSGVIYCGEAGTGSSMKLAINLLLGTMMAGLAEATHLAEASGLATETFLKVVGAGALACPLFKIKEQMLITDTYPPQFPFRHMAKDMQYVLQEASQNAVSLPVANRLAGLFDPHAPDALLDQDFAAVKTLLK